MKKIIYGGHWQEAPKGWVSIPEVEQDITKRLNQEDESVDIIFTEHTLEHLSLKGCVFFLHEAFRVLKTDGILRTVMPVINKMTDMDDGSYINKHYSDVQLKHYYPEEDAVLIDLGLTGISESPSMFMFDSLLKKHNHKMVWTTQLFAKVLARIGFKKIDVVEPGRSNFDKEDCLERIVRGIDPKFLEENVLPLQYDPESLVIEAKK